MSEIALAKLSPENRAIIAEFEPYWLDAGAHPSLNTYRLFDRLEVMLNEARAEGSREGHESARGDER